MKRNRILSEQDLLEDELDIIIQTVEHYFTSSLIYRSVLESDTVALPFPRYLCIRILRQRLVSKFQVLFDINLPHICLKSHLNMTRLQTLILLCCFLPNQYIRKFFLHLIILLKWGNCCERGIRNSRVVTGHCAARSLELKTERYTHSTRRNYRFIIFLFSKGILDRDW